MSWPRLRLNRRISGLFGASSGLSESALESGVEDIRAAMLSVLGNAGAKQFPQITRRIRYADNVKDLWYLRGDLMHALATLHGEAAARETIASITDKFQGLLPGGMSSRPSPLVG